MANDGTIQLLPDSTGKKVDTSEITRSTDGQTVERSRVVLGDDAVQGALMSVSGEPDRGAARVNAPTAQDLLFELVQSAHRIEDLLHSLAG